MQQGFPFMQTWNTRPYIHHYSAADKRDRHPEIIGRGYWQHSPFVLQACNLVSADRICHCFPVAWWTMNKWLEDFAYRIHIGWWVFVVAAAALAIALLTVSFQAIKAAIANPVESLRTE